MLLTNRKRECIINANTIERNYAMKNNKKDCSESTVITKNNIVSILVLAITVLNFLALVFALIDARIEYVSEEVDSHFANGFTLIFGKCPMAIEENENLLTFFSVLHFTVALIMLVALGIRLAVAKKLNFGKSGTACVVLSSVFTTLYFVLGCVAYAGAEVYRDLNYSVNTFSFIPFALMIILVSSFILVKVKLPKNYKIVLKKK